MDEIHLGRSVVTNQLVTIPTSALQTHMHLIGATGTGKSAAIHLILRQLLQGRGDNSPCIFIFDPLGNLSRDLLRLLAYERYIPQSVRDRVVYIEPASTRGIPVFNPLLHRDEKPSLLPNDAVSGISLASF